jgi:tRNA threonylcarbamoyl adenosine modification protein YeaZ
MGVTRAGVVLTVLAYCHGRGVPRVRRTMTVLALDTASPRPAVALWSDGRLFEEPLPDDRRASEDLLPAVRKVLARAGRTLRECDRIAVCAGPGSFTGLRVGLATAWGFGRAAGLSVEGVSTLEAIAEASRGPGRRRLVAALDAGRGDVVAERFDLSGERARSMAAPALLRAEALAAFAGEDPVAALPETGLAGALAEAVARAPRERAPLDPRRGIPAIYSRPSAAEEKHGSA